MTSQAPNSLTQEPEGVGGGRWLTWIVGSVSLLAYAYLAHASQAYGQATLAKFLGVFTIASVAAFGLFVAASCGKLQLRWGDVLLFALLFRAAGVMGYPVLEDDHFRYLWDAWVFWNTGSPYGVPPSDYFDVDLDAVAAGLLDGINYPDVPTVYGPTAQWLFAASYWLSPGAIWPLQLLTALADIGIVLLLRQLVALRWVVLYAWSPLLVKEFAFTAHIDVVGAFLLFAAIVALHRVRVAGIAVGVLLALAAGVKVFALLAVPFLLQNAWRGWLGFGVAACLLAVPLLGVSALEAVTNPGVIAAAWFPAGLTAMGQSWLFNAGLYLAALEIIGWAAITPMKLVLGFAFLIVSGWGLFWSCRSLVWPWRVAGHNMFSPHRTVAVTGYVVVLSGLMGLLFLLILPVFNPWYLVWWLPIALVAQQHGGWLVVTPWAASVVVALSYVTGLNTGCAAAAVPAANVGLGNRVLCACGSVRMGPNKPSQSLRVLQL